jgi:hypothetical protein
MKLTCSACHAAAVYFLVLSCNFLQAASFRLSGERVFTPLVTLAIIIQRYPDVSQ